jgi:5'/3'-nucleotidase SurE
LLALMLATFAQLTSANACEPEALNILLTNDDGYDSIGIVALHRALQNAGHRVTRVAPNRNYSGSSTSLTLDLIKAPQVPNQEFTRIFAVSGSPATSVLLGATALFTADQPAQLVISGINDGANLGPATPTSGTVGAAIAAIKLLNPALFNAGYVTVVPIDGNYTADSTTRLVELSNLAP